MATLDYDIPAELMTVRLPDLIVNLQEIWDQTADFLSSFRAMSTDNFMFAGGKDDLGGGLNTAISLTLVDWLIRFAAQPGPTFVATEISGGNLIGKVGSLQGATQATTSFCRFSTRIKDSTEKLSQIFNLLSNSSLSSNV